jgi:hypothetical protein
MSVSTINFSRRLILPGLGVVVFLFAYMAQNVWHLFHIDDITRAMRGLDPVGLAIGMTILGFVEATIVLCFYIPGTAVVIVLLLGMQPSWGEAWSLVAGLMVGTMLGYGASLVLGRWLQQKLPALVGEAYFHRAQSLIALSFAILGYFQAQRVWRYFVVAALAQPVWWAIYASAADLIARQNVVSSSNFQLYVAALFSIWFIYELCSRQPQKTP